MNKNFLLYGYGGAYNHGGEAIVQCCIREIRRLYSDCQITLSTHFRNQDVLYNVLPDFFCERDDYYVELDKKAKKKGIYNEAIYKSTIDSIDCNTIGLSIGGDNYCYEPWHRWECIHNALLKKGSKSILFSSSVGADYFNNKMKTVLASHDLITARESQTFDFLQKEGIENIELCADVAFLLPIEKLKLDEKIEYGRNFAINISPLIMRKEQTKGIILKNIKKLIDFLLIETDYNIVLIPHVVVASDNDWCILKQIFDIYSPHIGRLYLMAYDLSASQLKYVISKCEYGIYARTHATIASYSMNVPCIALSYSIKARGIANDMAMQDYLLEIEYIEKDDDVLRKVKTMFNHRQHIKKTLENRNALMKERANKNFTLLKKYI